MNAEQTILEAIAADPKDDTAWLALADCLEEEGQTDRAELVRLREWLRHAALDDPERPMRESRLQELLAAGVKPAVPMQRVEIAEGIAMHLALIPPGSFWMGGTDAEHNRWTNEGPRHRVTLTRGFYLAIHHITIQQWHTVVEPGQSSHRPDCPITSVNWNACMNFARALERRAGRRFRLPTEAEWEYACRAGTTTTYHSGSNEEALAHTAWYRGHSPDQPQPVGQKIPNAWGLYDMHGNAWEWCSDNMRTYTAEPVTDPVGGLRGTKTAEARGYRTIRGGSILSVFWRCRADCRFAYNRLSPHGDLGCRLAMDLD
jgi:uncharacterized protein (TIGR02996 family)